VVYFSTLEVCKEFQEEAYTVSLHPSGLFILVGFSDKLKLFTILIDDLRPFKEFSIRGCREALFSNGGHLFAAVHGNVIQIYSTVTFENITNLKGHNGKVRPERIIKKKNVVFFVNLGSAINLVT
jgi:WD40 repeat protein